MPEQFENLRTETTTRERKGSLNRISFRERLRRREAGVKVGLTPTRTSMSTNNRRLYEHVIGFPEGPSARIESVLISELERTGLLELPSGFWICREMKPDSAIDYVRYVDAGGHPVKFRFAEWEGLRRAIVLALHPD